MIRLRFPRRRSSRHPGALVAAFLLALTLGPPAWARSDARGGPDWPPGTVVLPFENLEGLLLIPASITGNRGRDTSGVLVLDTGAGFLALDRDVAAWAGIADSVASSDAIGLTARPLPRLSLGDLQIDQSSPVMTIDGGIVRAVTDRDVLGLLGQSIVSDRALSIDFRSDRLALIPSAASDSGASIAQRIRDSRAAVRLLTATDQPLEFRLAGDGKILVRAVIRNSDSGAYGPPLTLILDTGSTKCVLFRRSMIRIPGHRTWKTARGLTAPTLLGTASASIARIPRFGLDSPGAVNTSGGSSPPTGTNARGVSKTRAPIEITGLDVALLDTPLAQQLSTAVGQRVDGLLGVSFLARFHVVIDYPHRVLWLDPIQPWKDPRPYEYCHVGLQLERRGPQLRVAGLVESSPAATAGVRVGDDLVSIDGVTVAGLDVPAANRRLEGRPGTIVTIETRRDGTIARHRLKRKRLL